MQFEINLGPQRAGHQRGASERLAPSEAFIVGLEARA